MLLSTWALPRPKLQGEVQRPVVIDWKKRPQEAPCETKSTRTSTLIDSSVNTSPARAGCMHAPLAWTQGDGCVTYHLAHCARIV